MLEEDDHAMKHDHDLGSQKRVLLKSLSLLSVQQGTRYMDSHHAC